jgi:hypothetical protein
MIVCINPRHQDFDENIHVMQFAEMASEVHLIHLTTAFNVDFKISEINLKITGLG